MDVKPMKNLIEYKGYQAELCVDVEDNLIYGRVVNLDRDVISFHAETIENAKTEFTEMIDEYLADCAAEGVLPDVPKVMTVA
jgi:predicted HicB family RNase H-like nuclease